MISAAISQGGGTMLGALLKFLFKEKSDYRFDLSAAKRMTRIILIDDDPAALPINDLQQDGYAVHQQNFVDASLLSRCESGDFDIILLDYNGIAPASISETDGFGVFDRIRKANPEQYIISVSAQTYDISKTAYFKEANDWLRKPTDLSSTKNALDKGIAYLFDKTALLQRLRSQALREGATLKQADKLVKEFEAKELRDPDAAIAAVKKICGFVNVTNSIASTTRLLSKVCGIAI
jgi:CheY-like chemotaxis protein